MNLPNKTVGDLGPATGPLNGLRLISNFLATKGMKTLCCLVGMLTLTLTLPAQEAAQIPVVKTPEEIRKVFTTMGNTKTVVNVGRQKTYSFLDLRGYFKFVDAIEAEYDSAENDGIRVTDGSGRKVSMMSMAAAFFLLKDEKGFPQANAAIGYVPLENREYTAVFVMADQGGYTAFLADKTTPLLSKESYLGVMVKGQFVRFKYLEFDLPRGKLSNP